MGASPIQIVANNIHDADAVSSVGMRVRVA